MLYDGPGFRCGIVPTRCISNVCDATDLNEGFASSCSRVIGGGALGSLVLSLSALVDDCFSSSNGQHIKSIFTKSGTASTPARVGVGSG